MGGRSPLTAALPGGGAAEHGGELRSHVRSIAKVEAGRRIARSRRSPPGPRPRVYDLTLERC